jgi:hypothetical protein
MTDGPALFIRQEWNSLQRDLDSLRPEQKSGHAFFYQAKKLGFLRGDGHRRPMLRRFAIVEPNEFPRRFKKDLRSANRRA